jgi:hypothetical protein
MSIIAERVEAFQSASVWDVEEDQKQFEFEVQDET